MSARRTDKLVHLLLGGGLVSLAMQLVNKSHRADDERADLQKQLNDAVDDDMRRRERLLQRATELARTAGLAQAACARFETALRDVDAAELPPRPEPSAVSPPLVDPRDALSGEKQKTMVY